MDLKAMGSCVVKEITGLANSTPENALLQFCQKVEDHWYNYETNLSVLKGRMALNAFYVFTGCVEKGMFSSDAYGGVSYAPNFKAFLEREGLGVVIETERKENPLYAPPHKVQVFVWSPNHERLQAWWEKKDEKVKERETLYVAMEQKREETLRLKRKEQERQREEFTAGFKQECNPLYQPSEAQQTQNVPGVSVHYTINYT